MAFNTYIGVLGVLLLIYCGSLIKTGESCEGSYKLYPKELFSPVTDVTIAQCSGSWDLRLLSKRGAGIGGACSRLEQCVRDTFSFGHFPYIRFILALFLIFFSIYKWLLIMEERAEKGIRPPRFIMGIINLGTNSAINLHGYSSDDEKIIKGAVEKATTYEEQNQALVELDHLLGQFTYKELSAKLKQMSKNNPNQIKYIGQSRVNKKSSKKPKTKFELLSDIENLLGFEVTSLINANRFDIIDLISFITELKTKKCKTGNKKKSVRKSELKTKLKSNLISDLEKLTKVNLPSLTNANRQNIIDIFLFINNW